MIGQDIITKVNNYFVGFQAQVNAHGLVDIQVQ